MISTVRKVVSIALLHFVTMIPHGLQEIDSKQNPEGSNSSKSGDFIYFERQFGEKLAQNTKQLFEGNWFQQINNSTLTKQQLNVAKSIAGQTGDELKMVIAKLYPTQPSTFVFSPIRISEDGQLVIAEVTWDSASDQFVIRNFFWNMFQYDGEVCDSPRPADSGFMLSS